MTIKYIARILFYFLGCLAAVSLLFRGIEHPVAAAAAGSALLYALPLVKGPLCWLLTGAVRYGFLALLLRSLPGLVLIVVAVAVGLPTVLVAGVALGGARMVWHLVLAIWTDLDQNHFPTMHV